MLVTAVVDLGLYRSGMSCCLVPRIHYTWLGFTPDALPAATPLSCLLQHSGDTMGTFYPQPTGVRNRKEHLLYIISVKINDLQ